jgi:hypothetical protein
VRWAHHICAGAQGNDVHVVPLPPQHGTCIGGKLTRSKAAFFGTGLAYVKKFTKPGTAAQRAFSANAGKNVTLEFLNAAYSAPLINQVRFRALSYLPPATCCHRAPALRCFMYMSESMSGSAVQDQLPAQQLMGPGLWCLSLSTTVASDALQPVLQWSAACRKHLLLPSASQPRDCRHTAGHHRPVAGRPPGGGLLLRGRPGEPGPPPRVRFSKVNLCLPDSGM